MVRDARPSLTPPGAYYTALNAINGTREELGQFLVNEESNRLAATFSGEIVGTTLIEERNQALIFVNNGGTSELHLFHIDDEVTELVATDKEFGCDWGFGKCEHHYAEIKSFGNCNELHAYWSSDCTYHVINIDEMLDPVRKNAVKMCEDCSYFDIFRCVCGPSMSATSVENSGSTLEAGSYSFAIQLEDNDGNTTNVFDVSTEVKIGSENNIPGEISSNSIRLRLENLDPRYDKVIIYVIKTVAGVTTFERLDDVRSYSDGGITFNYYGQKGVGVDPATVTLKNKAYLRGRDLIQKDGRLWFYGIRNERNLNYQKYANEISVEGVEYEVSMENQLRYNFPNLMRGEVYAFGIVWKYCDGTYSNVFHIPAGGGSSGGGGSVGAPIEKTKVDDSAVYDPLKASDLSTTEQFARKRNPENSRGEPLTSDKLEQEIKDRVDNLDTTRDDVIAASDCIDCNCEGGDCGQLNDAMTNDLDDITGTYQSNAEILAGMGVDDKDPDVDQTTSPKEAAQKLIEDGVENREYVERNRPKLNKNGGFIFEDFEGGAFTEAEEEGLGKSVKGDNWVDGLGMPIIEDYPKIIDRFPLETYESEVDYPDNKDCEGEFFYPQSKQKFHKIPFRPHFISYQNGVVNKYQPENYEYGRTYTRPIGIRVSNIRFPEEDELPKPLCPTSPYKIVYVKRTDSNKSVFAKGWLSGMFRGDVYGEEYLYPRHGVNSKHTVDRFIASGDDGTSRKGQHYDGGAYTFHSPDTDLDKSYLPITHVTQELSLKGNGWLHGLYARGRRVIQDQWAGTRVDQRGARVSNNLNHYDVQNGGRIGVRGLTFAPGDSVVSAPDGVALPLNNRYRESSVYLETSGRLAGDERDDSFPGGVLDHFGPTTCNAPYCGLIRDLPDQYGSVESLQYIELGLNATKVHATNKLGVIEGLAGDTWIVPYSKRRTSYVSNKVGDRFNVPAKPGSECRERSWCDSPDDAVFQYLGINHYPTRLPESGDIYNPKNYAGLHTINGDACGSAISRNHADAASQPDSESDYYFPRVLKSLVHTVVESHVNTNFRQTGLNEGEVYYPKLKDLNLDSDAPTQHPWEDSYLNRFYCEVEQPSLKQLAKKALIRNAINLLVPAGSLPLLFQVDNALDGTALPFVFSLLAAFWIFANNTLFTDTKLNELLGIGDCRTDSEGGDLDECIVQWEDNYNKYSWEYSKVNETIQFLAFPSNYNTCDCDSCDPENLNNEIYYSNKQNLDSEIDAYVNVKINNYKEIPAERGRLVKLFTDGRGFYAHTTDGISIMQVAPAALPGDISSQILGTGELLSEPQFLFEGIVEGYAGTSMPNAAINTSFGYFFIDDNARKIYRWAEGRAEEISAYGMRNFFKEHLTFCNPKSCIDEKTNSSVFYSLGFDHRYNRLLVTKKDGVHDTSFTASFTPIGAEGRGKWIGFHSYIPNNYLWDRNNFYTIVGGQIWKHHVKGSYQNFYGEKHPHIIEATTVGQIQGSSGNKIVTSWKLANMKIDSEADRDGLYDLDTTFNKIAIFNSTQGTGTLPVNIVSDDAGEITSQEERTKQDLSKLLLYKKDRIWDSSQFYDLVRDGCEHPQILIPADCKVIADINENIFTCEAVNAQDFRNRKLIDKYVTYRLIFDETTDTRLVTKYIMSMFAEPPK